MSDEITAMNINQTYTITTLPPGKKATCRKWVYKIKFRSDGNLECYKARLIAMETYAPVAKMDIVLLFLGVAAGRGYKVHQMDVDNAFLHSDLEEEVYIKIPTGFKSSVSSSQIHLRLKTSTTTLVCKTIYCSSSLRICCFAI